MKLDFETIRSMPQRNTLMKLYRGALAYFRENGAPMPTHATIETDLHRVPEGVDPSALHYRLISDGNKPVAAMALVVGYPQANTLYLRRLILPEALRGQGYEQAILNVIVAKYQGQMTDLQTMIVNATPERLKFWQDLGFRVINDAQVALASGDIQHQTTLQFSLPSAVKTDADHRQPALV
ncbi:GNAT family N-acetyltransferase [Lacticaseibacillus sp. N501-2]|uniref:GNAT family N-acetyltransferase n=1 Tax=Lacticaseibacillus salsurae TaxID=3367729 RepID=UPI0038B26D8F